MSEQEIKYKQMLNNVALLTDYNDHTEARIAIAKFFGMRNRIDDLESLQRQQNRLGYMTEDLLKERAEITKTIYNRLIFTCGIEIAKEVMSKL